MVFVWETQAIIAVGYVSKTSCYYLIIILYFWVCPVVPVRDFTCLTSWTLSFNWQENDQILQHITVFLWCYFKAKWILSPKICPSQYAVPQTLLLCASSNNSFIYRSIIGHISTRLVIIVYCNWTPFMVNCLDLVVSSESVISKICRLLTKLLSWMRRLFNSWFPVRSGFHTPLSGLGFK